VNIAGQTALCIMRLIPVKQRQTYVTSLCLCSTSEYIGFLGAMTLITLVSLQFVLMTDLHPSETFSSFMMNERREPHLSSRLTEASVSSILWKAFWHVVARRRRKRHMERQDVSRNDSLYCYLIGVAYISGGGIPLLAPLIQTSCHKYFCL